MVYGNNIALFSTANFILVSQSVTQLPTHFLLIVGILYINCKKECIWGCLDIHMFQPVKCWMDSNINVVPQEATQNLYNLIL